MELPISVQENVQIAKDAFAAFGRGDMQGLLPLSAEGIEWIIPSEWPLAGTHRGHAGVADLFQKISEMLEISFSEPREFVINLRVPSQSNHGPLTRRRGQLGAVPSCQ